MDTNAQQLVDAASRLSPAERVELVNAILDSIPIEQLREGDAHNSSEISEAWEQEIARRKAEVQTGQVTLIPKSEAVPGPRDNG